MIMKKILLIVLFNFTLFANTSSCMLDVYFGNGVWNSYKEAEASKNELRTFIQNNNPSRFAIKDEDVTYSLKNAYNHTYGTSIDLIETHWQLYESGQISEGYFSFVAHVLDGRDTEEKFLKDLREIIAQSDADTSDMYAKYQEESFNVNHNVLLVSHSQGNLFANKIYAILDAPERNKFRNIAIATPAEKVLSGGSYVTLNFDYVVGGIPGSLPGNTDGVGHTFVDSYINNSASAIKMSTIINQEVAALDEKGCGDYIAFEIVGYVCPHGRSDQELAIDIYGATDRYGYATYVHELVLESSQVRIPKEVDVDGYLSCPLKNLDVETMIPKYDEADCDAYVLETLSGEVTGGSYENSYTCTRYGLSGETIKMLNKMLGL